MLQNCSMRKWSSAGRAAMEKIGILDERFPVMVRIIAASEAEQLRSGFCVTFAGVCTESLQQSATHEFSTLQSSHHWVWEKLLNDIRSKRDIALKP